MAFDVLLQPVCSGDRWFLAAARSCFCGMGGHFPFRHSRLVLLDETSIVDVEVPSSDVLPIVNQLAKRANESRVKL